jgi:single-strand DNA-binding protein
MSRGSVNKVIILGRLGADPEIRYMPSGITLASLSVATNDFYKNKNTGENTELTEWHRVSVFGKMADTIQKYVKKGDLIFIEGKLNTRKWQDQQGINHYSTEIKATNMQLMSNKSQSNAPIPDYIPAHVDVSQPKKEEAKAPVEIANEYHDIPF